MEIYKLARMIPHCIGYYSVSQARSLRELANITTQEMPDDNLFVCHPCVADNDPGWFDDDHALLRSINTDLPDDATRITVLTRDGLPTKDEFRGSWKLDGIAAEHDMTKARAILKDKLRLDRAPKLSALDIEYQRADEIGDTAAKAEVATRKQVLRDVTDNPKIEAAATAEELKALLPNKMI